VTTFNRGKTHPGELPAEVEQLVGDRNGKLDALKNRQWDVVIDNPTTLPAWVRDAAQLLKGNVDRYIFISTISVYGEVKQGGDVLAPGNPNDPVQFIDARDLAEWTIRMAENHETGIYDATGPAKPLGIGVMLDGIKDAGKSNANLIWVSEEFLTQQKVEAWS